MKRFPLLLLGILSIVAFSIGSAASGESATPAPSPYQGLVEGNSAFAVQLYGKLGSSEGNLLFSPYSISSALGMTYAGARGNTAKQMRDVLHVQLSQGELSRAFKGLNRELLAAAGRGGQTLDIANGLFLTGGNVSDGYKAVLKKDFDAGIFSGGLAAVNDWVKRKTGGKIEKILDGLNPNSVCVILNAIYFKGVWEKQFDRNATRDAPFTVSPTRRVTVPLMYQHGSFTALAEKEFQAVSLPYRGNGLSMVVLLPRAVDGLPGLEKQVTGQNLKSWLAKLDRQPRRKMHLYLPKFRLTTDYDLAKPCADMGMKDAFSPKRADFRGMGWKKGDLWISQIRHKAFMEVNEEGTEAAAATGVEIATKAFIPEQEFRADHPFLFIIRDARSGAILFLGRMVDPAKS